LATLKQNLKYHYLLFLISPILGLVHGLKTKSKKYIRWSIFIFTVIYGSLLHPSFLGDGRRHWERVYDHYQYLDFSVFWTELMAILSLAPLETTNDDPYIHLLSYLVGGIFNAPGLFFVAVAVVYAYFYSGAIVKLLSYVNWSSNYNKFFFLFFLVIFLLWIPPLKMQTVRTWTGMWVLVYAILSYHETKKKKYLFLALMPPFIHVGYLALALPIWAVLFSGFRKPIVYFLIFISSIFVSNFVEQIGFNKFASQTELGASKTKAYYVDDDRAEQNARNSEGSSQNNRFYKVFASNKIHLKLLTGLIIFMFIFLRKRGFGRIENTLFSYGLAMAAFANFFTSIFAVHNRGWNIAGVLILSLLVIFLSKQNFKNISFSTFKIKLPLYIFSIGFIPYLLYLMSDFLSFTSPYVFFLPLINWIEPDMGISIRGLIGLLL
jgi:hypothetical protein